MNDTSLDILEKQREIFHKKTSQERFLIGAELIEMGRIIIESSIKNNKPDISEIDLKIEVFKRYYSDYFSDDELQKIIISMRNYYLNRLPK